MFHYFIKAYHLGFFSTFIVIKHRITQFFHYRKLRKQAFVKAAHHGWSAIQEKHRYAYDFAHFFQELQNQHIGVADFLMHENIKQETDEWLHASMPWQEDVAAGYIFKSQFYKNIKITTTHTEQLGPDIKAPWELSRFLYAPLLGIAYRQTGNEIYAQTIVHHMHDWIEKNPYLMTVNWVCPMDVAIRALNWVIAFQYCQNYGAADEWQPIICSLYDHLIYLEQNWEIYDARTSNHYLSDLVGYFYLTHFFAPLHGMQQKRDWVIQEILREFDKQVFHEGASYEGSTLYHRLVTELFHLFFALAKQQGHIFSPAVEEKFQRMLEFIDWCTPVGGNLIQIGDNDSGYVLWGLSVLRLTSFAQDDRRGVLIPPGRHSFSDGGSDATCPSKLKERSRKHCIEGRQARQDDRGVKIVSKAAHPERGCKSESKDMTGTKHFNQFGLSIIKTDRVHLTLRHHAYELRQPSGHFHNDVAGITLSVDGKDILVDPGSYIYTPSSVWRNRFRSAQMHSSSYVVGQEPIELTQNIFYLDIPSKVIRPKNKDPWLLQTSHDFYHDLGLKFHRSVQLDHGEQKITIIDWWEKTKYDIPDDIEMGWNFTFGPAITLEEASGWNIYYQDRQVATMHSTIGFEKNESWYSSAYGQKEPTTSLQAKSKQCDEAIVTVIEYI